MYTHKHTPFSGSVSLESPDSCRLRFSKHGGGPCSEAYCMLGKPSTPQCSLLWNSNNAPSSQGFHEGSRRWSSQNILSGARLQESLDTRCQGKHSQCTNTFIVLCALGGLRVSVLLASQRGNCSPERSECAPSHPAVLPAPVICKARASHSHSPLCTTLSGPCLAGHRKLTGIPAHCFHLPEIVKSTFSS